MRVLVALIVVGMALAEPETQPSWSPPVPAGSAERIEERESMVRNQIARSSDGRMRVGDEIVHWEEGRSYVFDDTNPHEVWNDSGEERIVLLLQFLRPLRAPGRQLSQLFLSALRLSPYLRLPLARGKIFDEELRRVIEARGIAYPDDAPACDART